MAARARIYGGLALARLEKFDDATIWLSAGVSIAERIITEGMRKVHYAELRALCGDAYHELARLALHRKENARAQEMARLGIEHRMGLLHLVESSAVHFQLTDLYMLLLDALPRNDLKQIGRAFEDAVAIVLTGCKRFQTDKKICRQFAERLFKFAIGITKDAQSPDAQYIQVWALSLYPLLESDELVENARTMSNRLSSVQLPENLSARLKKMATFVARDNNADDK